MSSDHGGCEDGDVGIGNLPERIVASGWSRDPNVWIEHNRTAVEAGLNRCGAVLMRGFDFSDVSIFQKFAKRQLGDLLPYIERSTPRSEVGEKIYTSTDYPSDQEIALHNEFSYATEWPRWVMFYCVTPAACGGETPIADGREVYRKVAAEVRDRFERLGVMYIRRYGWGIDLSWEDAFGTSDARAVEAYCRAHAIECDWKERGRLVTRQVRPATVVHPTSGDKVWFNQAHLFHATNLPTEVRVALMKVLGKALPREARYGDGSEISEGELIGVRRALHESSRAFEWRTGDVLWLDNVRVAHGRRSFQGSRRILVAMGSGSPAAT